MPYYLSQYWPHYTEFSASLVGFIGNQLIRDLLQENITVYKTQSSYVSLQAQNITIFQDLVEIRTGFNRYVRHGERLDILNPLDWSSTVLMTQMLSVAKVIERIQKRLNQRISDKIEQYRALLVNLMAGALAVFSLIYWMIIFVHCQQTRAKLQILRLFEFVRKSVLDYEIEQLQNSSQLLSAHQKAFVDEYQFSLLDLDYRMEREVKRQENIHRQMASAKKQNLIKFPRFQFLDIKTYLVLLLASSVFYGIILIQHQQKINFIDRFKRQSQVYQTFCQSQFQTASMLNYKEYLYIYLAKVVYLQIVYKRSDFIEQFLQLNEEIKHFASSDMVQDYADIQSPRFELLYRRAQDSNMCRTILNLTSTELAWCEKMLGGSLKRGLSQAILAIIYDLKTEFDQTEFLLAKRYEPASPVDNFFGIQFTTQVIQALIQELKASINDSISAMIRKTHSDIILIMASILCVALLYGFYIYQAHQTFFVTKSIVMLVPQLSYLQQPALVARLQLVFRSISYLKE